MESKSIEITQIENGFLVLVLTTHKTGEYHVTQQYVKTLPKASKLIKAFFAEGEVVNGNILPF